MIGSLALISYTESYILKCTAYLSDIGKLNWVKHIINKASKIVQLVTRHHASLALFRKFSESDSGSKRSLQKPGEQ